MGTSLLSLPRDILILLPEHIHNIEDYTNLASTSRELRVCMNAATPKSVLRLAAARSRTFFRPSPHFLVAATARELGVWARQSDAHEQELASKLENGIDALLDLALDHCGLTMERIRELHLMRFSTINPAADIIDQCVGKQWYRTPRFWNGGVSDAYTISSEPHESVFHLAIYGELFGPDLDAFLNQNTSVRRLSVDTRIEFIKYCLPDFATTCTNHPSDIGFESADPRRRVKRIGPYVPNEMGNPYPMENHNLALTWVLRSSRWRPHWKRMRAKAGPDFQDDFRDLWLCNEEQHHGLDWRQRMWENVMVCQGLDGLGMIRPSLQDQWVERVREWREKICELEKEPELVKVGRHTTLEYPFLLGDMRVCAIGKFRCV